LEFGCAQKCTVFTTVSDVTARECRQSAEADARGDSSQRIELQRFEALHEFQNLHALYKENLNEFVMGHFFQSIHLI